MSTPPPSASCGAHATSSWAASRSTIGWRARGRHALPPERVGLEHRARDRPRRGRGARRPASGRRRAALVLGKRPGAARRRRRHRRALDVRRRHRAPHDGRRAGRQRERGRGGPRRAAHRARRDDAVRDHRHRRRRPDHRLQRRRRAHARLPRRRPRRRSIAPTCFTIARSSSASRSSSACRSSACSGTARARRTRTRETGRSSAATARRLPVSLTITAIRAADGTLTGLPRHRARHHGRAPGGARAARRRGALPQRLRQGADRQGAGLARRPLHARQRRALPHPGLHRARPARDDVPVADAPRRPRAPTSSTCGACSRARASRTRWRSATGTRTGTTSGRS